jgi:thiosulfate dehydrogenase [quinone] large subunit
MQAWENWESFVDYTKSLNPLVPDGLVPMLAVVATAL